MKLNNTRLRIGMMGGFAFAVLQVGCIALTPADPLAKIQDPRIDEASGIVASRRYPGLFYVHNDSGDLPRVFLIDEQGATRALITLEGASARDYEDIAIAPGSDPKTYDVVVADTGDNNHVRDETVLYRFPEPELPTAPDEEPTKTAPLKVQPTRYRLHYANGPVDAEALFVHPQTGDGYILTKRRDGEPSDIYVLPAPWKSDGVNKLERIGSVDLVGMTPFQRLVTAADISADGRRIALRTYLGGWEWIVPAGHATSPSEFLKIFAKTPKWLVLPPERQAEALTYTLDARHLITISEKAPTYLNQTAVETTTRDPAANDSRRHEDNHARETDVGHPPSPSDESPARE